MLYEYKCDKCEEHFDEMRSVDDRNIPIKCPLCSDGMGHRVLITNFSFKMGKGRRLTPREVFSKGIKKKRRKGPENIVVKNPHPDLKKFGF